MAKKPDPEPAAEPEMPAEPQHGGEFELRSLSGNTVMRGKMDRFGEGEIIVFSNGAPVHTFQTHADMTVRPEDRFDWDGEGWDHVRDDIKLGRYSA